ncbi:MAG: hypothetical protein HYV32_05765 [Candidatus Kerfeldbacteria bacterium]|nr:hypothetical protein [Candidatus Kerfeldbacteria bacterium]
MPKKSHPHQRLTHCRDGKIHYVDVPQKFVRTIDQQINTAIAQAAKLFEYSFDPHIILCHDEYSIIPETGITGRAVNAHRIMIEIDFSRTDIASIISEQLPSTLYHETSHLVRQYTHGFKWTLLDCLVSEGIAGYIEKSTQPDIYVPYIEPMKNETALMKKARRVFNSKNFNYNDWFFGGNTIPRWAGYRLGYILVESYMKKHDISIAKLIRLSSKNFLPKKIIV